MKKHEIPKPILEKVEAELLSNEDLLWVGQPHPNRFIFKQSEKTNPVLATFIGLEIALFLISVVTFNFLPAVLLFFALLLTTLVGGIAQQLYRAKNTIYAVTNQRAMVIKGSETETFGHQDLQSILKKNRSKGRGDLIFRKDNQTRLVPSGFGLMLHRQEEIEKGFFGIENANQVEALLLSTFVEKKIDTTRLEDQQIVVDDYYDEVATMEMSQK